MTGLDAVKQYRPDCIEKINVLLGQLQKTSTHEFNLFKDKKINKADELQADESQEAEEKCLNAGVQ